MKGKNKDDSKNRGKIKLGKTELRVVKILDLVMNTIYWFEWMTENQEVTYKMIWLSMTGGATLQI